MTRLEELAFRNTYHQLGSSFQSPWLPARVEEASTIAVHPDAAALLELPRGELERPELAQYLSGSKLWPQSKPLVQVYGGQAGGEYLGRLGDGRQVVVGQIATREHGIWDLALKGAGPTPHSRGGNGRLGLREGVREFLGLEALHALGVPTSRALALIDTGVPAGRGDGQERAVVLARLAPTHVRFGTFQYFYHLRQGARVRNLAHHVLQTLWPELGEGEDRFLDLLARVVRVTAELVAAWQAVGFCHGRMHTDDLSVAGITLDLGPFAFVEAFDPDLAPDPEDREGRYRFAAQPEVARFSLLRFGETLLELVSPEEAMDAIARFETVYADAYRARMREKLGLPDADDAVVDELVRDLGDALARGSIDSTTFFRHLARFRPGVREGGVLDPWLGRYEEALARERLDPEKRAARMNRSNPAVIPRAADLDDAVAHARRGDPSRIRELAERYRRPFDGDGGPSRPDGEPDVRRSPGCPGPG